MDFLPIVEGRSCGDCTKCCEGHLRADINLKDGTPTVWMGIDEVGRKPCAFVKVGEGCTVYEKRPDSPCAIFRCDWLTNPDMPESFKPSRSNSIFTTRSVRGVQYTKLIEAGRKLDSEVLSWAFEYYMGNALNFSWNVLENIFWLGSEEFNNMMEEDYPLLANPGHGKDSH